MGKENLSELWTMGLLTIKELETEMGVLASGKEEIYGCIFGRDSLITALKLLKTYKKNKDEYLLNLVRKIIINIADLQGKKINIESGEEPGKCIHEYRPDNHERLTKHLPTPWYVYSDGSMRNYDTVDATPLFLICVFEYLKITEDDLLKEALLPNIISALDWILVYGDKNNDGFIDYQTDKNRTFGGLQTQSWMDSHDSIFREDGGNFAYPIAPVEVQGYTFCALKMWAEYFAISNSQYAKWLNKTASKLKKEFNKKFVSVDNGNLTIAFAVDGSGKQLISTRSSIGHLLWATYKNESILHKKYFKSVVKKLMQPDIFEEKAGIRTLSKNSIKYNPNSYHNGSIWPHDNAIIISGFENFGFNKQANKLREALLNSYIFFQTPIELFVYDGEHKEYRNETGQSGCKKQAWSAAGLLSSLSTLISEYEEKSIHKENSV